MKFFVFFMLIILKRPSKDNYFKEKCISKNVCVSCNVHSWIWVCVYRANFFKCTSNISFYWFQYLIDFFESSIVIESLICKFFFYSLCLYPFNSQIGFLLVFFCCLFIIQTGFGNVKLICAKLRSNTQ